MKARSRSAGAERCRRCAWPSAARPAERGRSRWSSGRPPTGRTRIRSRGDVGDAGRHDDLDVVLLEVPGDPAHLGGGGVGAAGDQQHVGAGLGGDARDVVRAAEHGDAEAGGLAEVVGRRERADDVVAEPGLAQQDARDLVDVSRGAGDQHPLGEDAAAAGPVQRPAQQPATQHQERDADGEGQHVEAAGQVVAGQVAGDADGGGGGGRAAGDALELVGARRRSCCGRSRPEPDQEQPRPASRGAVSATESVTSAGQ